LGVAQGVYDLCRHVDFREIGVEFHIYGDGSERAEIKQYVSDHPKSNIFLHDAVAKKELQEILSDFHATVIPLATNIFGAFPSKIYMAISAALPIIFSGSGEGARFIEHHGIGWVTGPRNYQGLSELAKNLTKMTDADYFAFRSRIRSIALENFDFDDQLDRLVEFIN
jgi:glycosyltransferase involved in cell wall biosynthesis